jgi:hypothetical protein
VPVGRGIPFSGTGSDQQQAAGRDRLTSNQNLISNFGHNGPQLFSWTRFSPPCHWLGAVAALPLGAYAAVDSRGRCRRRSSGGALADGSRQGRTGCRGAGTCACSPWCVWLGGLCSWRQTCWRASRDCPALAVLLSSRGSWDTGCSVLQAEAAGPFPAAAHAVLLGHCSLNQQLCSVSHPASSSQQQVISSTALACRCCLLLLASCRGRTTCRLQLELLSTDHMQ